MSEETLDVAIVGAGVSGVYSAWRLRTDPPPGQPVPNVQVFEQSDRIGGRLLSVEPPGIPGLFCELGGMRYTSAQTLVRSLVENRLKLPTHPLLVDQPKNINYMRGEYFRIEDLIKGANIPYNLGWSERGRPIEALLGQVLDGLIPGVTKLGPAMPEFLREYKIDGRHIYNWGFWNLLARGMSHEAYELARVTCGYDTPLLNWNAYDTISLNFDLSATTTYAALTNGYQGVPLMLADLFKKAGGTINPGQRLESFTSGPDGTITLHIHDKKTGQTTVSAKKLILAMPRRSLELIDRSGPVLARPEVRELIETVTPIPLFKTFVVYGYPWWESVDVKQGRSVTDLPLRQVYYWGSGKARLKDPANRRSVLLASYDDTLNVDFWEGLAKVDPSHPPFEPVQDAYTEAHPGSQEWHDLKANKAMIAEVDRQLREMHNVRYAPPPLAAAFIDWGQDPYGGGVNFWNIHARSWEVIPQIAKPVADVPVYVMGEAYSNSQGWVEGALETAEIVLQQHLGLEAPEWVT